MRIDFYEEFPTKKNLEKLKMIDFPITLIAATKSWKYFLEIKRQINKIKRNVELVYWPSIKTTYWISPFSNTKDLIEFFEENKKIKHPYLFDLEFPMKNKILILKNFFKLWKHKKMIRNFVIQNKNYAILTIYPVQGTVGKSFMRLLGLDYDVKMKRKLMFYTSYLRGHFMRFLIAHFRKTLERLEDKGDVIMGIGVIAKGKITKTYLLTPAQLETDLKWCKKAGYNNVAIFRLGGLDKRYLEVIKKFVD